MDAEVGMYVKKLVAEPRENRACLWICKSGEDEDWPSDIEIRKLCTDTYPCEIDAYSIDKWGKGDTIRVVTIETL